MLTSSSLWKRVTLGAALGAVVLAGAPHAMADGRFHLPYGDGLNGPASPIPMGPMPHANPDPSAGYPSRFGPGLGDPSSGRPSADLQLAATSSPNPATQGQHFDYTFTVTNAGPAPTTDVSLTDQLPTDVRLVQAVASQGVCSLAQQYVRCALDTLNGGNAATVTLTVNAVRNGTISNTASVTGREYDPDEGNNTATATTDVQPGGQWAAELSVANAVDKATANPGDTLTYTINVTNAGPAVAVGTALTDQLPDGAAFVSLSPSQGTCSASNGSVACNLGDLASGATATVTVAVRANQPGTNVNTAYVTSQMLDNNTGDNQAQATTQVGGGSGPAPIGPAPAAPAAPSSPRSSRSGAGGSVPGPASAVG